MASGRHTTYVRCGIGQFRQYLEDMGSLKLVVVDIRNSKAIAYVLVNFGMFLKARYFFPLLIEWSRTT